MSFDFHGPGLWYATRATGLVALLLLTVSVLLGILTAGRFASGNWPRFLTQGLHRNISLLMLASPAGPPEEARRHRRHRRHRLGLRVLPRLVNQRVAFRAPVRTPEQGYGPSGLVPQP